MKKISMLLKELGIPYIVDPDYHLARHPTWDGELLRMPSDPDKIPTWVMHEINHFLFAPPAGRREPNWGLGTDPGGGSYTISNSDYYRGELPCDDELCVCLLDIWHLKKHGFSDEVIGDHLVEYGINHLNRIELSVATSLIREAGFPSDEVMACYHQYKDW